MTGELLNRMITDIYKINFIIKRSGYVLSISQRYSKEQYTKLLSNKSSKYGQFSAIDAIDTCHSGERKEENVM